MIGSWIKGDSWETKSQKLDLPRFLALKAALQPDPAWLPSILHGSHCQTWATF